MAEFSSLNPVASNGSISSPSSASNQQPFLDTEIQPIISNSNASNSGKRRKHKNSKLGCPNCKKRRVKCSEDLPQCLNCIKHKVKCGYLDYTDEQLEELKRAKAAQESQFAQSVSSASVSKHGSIPSSSSSALIQSNTNSDAVDEGVVQLNSLSIGKATKTTHNNDYHTVNNILNYPQNSISQNFDNLLTTAPDLSIVYPIYSIINNNIQTQPESHDTNTFMDIDSYNYHQADSQNYLLQSLSVSSSIPQDFLLEKAETPMPSEAYLPNAVIKQTSFCRIRKVDVDYETLLRDTIVQLKPLILTGTATLNQIKNLYNAWLNSFLYSACRSNVMFSCLVNLTTNFLISNNFNNFSKINSANFLNVTTIKNVLIIVSIKHYAIVIKGLRNYLNKNFDPQVCSSVSYILSLMSIYDPEATLNSINCFTDGLFSVLKYNLKISIKENITPPFKIPVHLKLIQNIAKSIYFPGYDPTFLSEYQVMLNSFGKILSQLNDSDPLMHQLNIHFNDLWNFADASISEYIPKVNSSLTDNQIQQETLFKMTYKWVRLFPARLLIINENSNLVEKILYLFFKLMKKSLFAILPQVKFYFLRDFDSPLMLDVHTFINDTDIFFDKEFDDLRSLSKFKPELKMLTSYNIRLLNYFQRRLNILYKTIVYESSSKNLFPSESIKRDTTNIEELRQTFHDTLNMKEVHIKAFSNTLIKPYHYLTSDGYTVDDEAVEVDYLTLTEAGFLRDDYL